jgi:hypothetical protein
MLFSKSKPAIKNARPEDTRINETSFRLILPGTWTPAPSNDLARRDYHTDSEQLTVSIFGSLFGAPGAMNHDAKVATFMRLVDKRRDVETKVPGSVAITVTEPLFGESGGVLAARYRGFDAGRQRRLHCMMLASVSAFEIFYYEAVDMTEAAAEDRAKAIFNSVDIPR